VVASGGSEQRGTSATRAESTGLHRWLGWATGAHFDGSPMPGKRASTLGERVLTAYSMADRGPRWVSGAPDKGLSIYFEACLSFLAWRFSFTDLAAGVLAARPPLSLPAMMASLRPG
jgi:hypothetical protein